MPGFLKFYIALTFSLLLSFCYSSSITAQKVSALALDTVIYREGLAKQRFEHDRVWVDRIKAKAQDSSLIWLEKGDILYLSGSSKRAVNLTLSTPSRTTLFSTRLGSSPITTDYEIRETGFHRVLISNAAFLFPAKIELRIKRIHYEETCTLYCDTFNHQIQSEPLPEFIETTVSNKTPQEFSIPLQVKDTLSLFMPGSRKIPRIEVWSPKGERLYTLESGKAPLKLQIPVLDTGKHVIKMSKSGLLGRIPTSHDLYLGYIRPSIPNDSCCTRIELIPKEIFQKRADTLVVVAMDSLIELGALRNIKKTSDYALKVNPYPSGRLISRFMLIAPADSSLHWEPISSALQGKKMADYAYASQVFSLLMIEYGNPSSKIRIYVNTEQDKMEKVIQSIDLFELDPMRKYDFRFFHKDPIQNSTFRIMILEFRPIDVTSYLE